MTTIRPAGHIHREVAPLRTQVIDALRQAILAAEYAPGDRLRERELCERWEVSRNVVREALRHLEADGLVTVIANRGPIVATLTRQDAEALYEARAALEAMAGRLFAERATPQQMTALRGSLRAVETAFAREDDVVGWIASKDAFYALLLECCGNTVIADLLRTIQQRVRLLRGVSLHHRGRREESVRELREVVEAIVARDGERARGLLELHVERAGRAAFDRLSATGDEFPGA
jgi:DNA-binding GntR family transcriptional regulator